MTDKHWISLGLGMAAWMLTRKHRSLFVRTAGTMVGTALLGRAVSERDGLAKMLRFLPLGRWMPSVK
jgi:hypothetical protein